ncbi:hypothetical protein M446_1583 [Methylobacterium sp. 4-46]|uniref:hypothetical protein n=1 Tax=unclassified Methylobacterium TaxID=2615210 RepID=UPI000152CED7|nr:MULTISPECIES: hypothetical protein [Methylobacterium]ACA16084.1 hypothetical protein M446_1583 [Methylobacterium sp. 4-46]WFT81795.1 hypothetical protein QA634_08020 [Methylobacterium nodulans]
MIDTPTIGDLHKRKRVTDEQLDAAVADYLNDPAPGPRQLAEGIAIDVCAIMQANPQAREVLAMHGSSDAQMRAAVRTAILLATPTRDRDAAAAREAGPASPTVRRRRAPGARGADAGHPTVQDK